MDLGEPEKIVEIPKPERIPDTVPQEQPKREAAGTSMTTRPGVGENLDTIRQDEPVHGWKLAKLRTIEGALTLAANTINITYKPDDQAVCIPGYNAWGMMHPVVPEHDVPNIDCSCGFYILKELPDLLAAGIMGPDNAVILEVEAYGILIQHERGWRAQHQRVLCVWLDPLCRGTKCRSHATHIVTNRTTTAKPACPNCGPVVPTETRYTPADIANQLHVETRWAT